MLVLTRSVGEAIVIDGGVRVAVLAMKGKKVRIGITAPDRVRVDRAEVHQRRFVPGSEQRRMGGACGEDALASRERGPYHDSVARQTTVLHAAAREASARLHEPRPVARNL